MSVFGKFQKYTPVALWGRRQGSNIIFFSSNLQRSPWEKKGGLSPPKGDRAPSPTPRATNQWA